MLRTAMVLVTSLVVITSGQTADKPQEGPVGLERKLHGRWKGPACGGDWTFASDATFSVNHYSPGNNELTGSWEVRWNALPPTLVLTVKSSNAPERIKVGESWEVKLVQLNDEALAYEWPENPGQAIQWTRVKK